MTNHPRLAEAHKYIALVYCDNVNLIKELEFAKIH